MLRGMYNLEDHGVFRYDGRANLQPDDILTVWRCRVEAGAWLFAHRVDALRDANARALDVLARIAELT